MSRAEAEGGPAHGAPPPQRAPGAVVPWRAIHGAPLGDRAGEPLSRSSALLKATRPRQWPKNVLVFAAPAAAGVISHPVVLGKTVAAFWLFVAASAAVYLVNDVLDRERDQLHPVKRHRPVAAGHVPAGLAVGVSVGLTVVAAAGAFALAANFGGVIVAYLLISAAYSLGLKRVPVVEMVCVVAGFVLRAVAGGACVGVPISPWFLVMTGFGALLVVAGKRSVEQRVMGDDGGDHRSALSSYPARFLRSVRMLAMTVTVTTYCLWAFERAADLRPSHRGAGMIWFELSIVPFLVAALMIELAIERGQGGEPEEMALTNHALQAIGVIWILLLVCGIYS